VFDNAAQEQVYKDLHNQYTASGDAARLLGQTPAPVPAAKPVDETRPKSKIIARSKKKDDAQQAAA
jgi:hypothetical protein